MKKGILSEIKKIKSLINILEQSNNDCEDQLEKSGYIVYNPQEKKTKGSECNEKEKIKCVVEFFETLKENNPTIDVNTLTTGSSCYVEFKAQNIYNYGSVSFNMLYWFFWESGDFSIVKSLKPTDISKYTELDNDNIFQVMRSGEFECVNSDIKLNNIKWSGYYKDNNTSKKHSKDITITNKNDSKTKKISSLLKLKPNATFKEIMNIN
tara:strand:- start:90 stop:716 length:627 start_codon:yes stop_codon:yes gene_type:complete